MNEFVIESQDPGTLFEFILSVDYGSTLFVTKQTFPFFISISRELFELGIVFWIA
jgi:hypothetical protein